MLMKDFALLLIEISGVSLGGKVISCSDEFFADASNLLKVGVSFQRHSCDRPYTLIVSLYTAFRSACSARIEHERSVRA